MNIRRLLSVSAAALLLGALTVQATTRINGNQLLEGSATVGRNIQRANPSGGAAGTAPILIYSVGQGVMASGTAPDSSTGVTSVAIGMGLAYDIVAVVYNVFCPITLTGDTDGDGSVNANDIITFVNYIYKGGPAPEPCPAVGDVNCSGDITTADCMILVNFIFQGGQAPCDVCPLVPGIWTCP
jgi:hypothetical protein